MTDRKLEVDRVSKAYGANKACDQMTFNVSAGEVFGFVGSNGAGKTTTMRIVLGVLDADSGDVRWDGKRVDLDLRRRIGYLPEERGVYPKMKVGEQLVYFGRLHGMSKNDAQQSTDKWLERLGIADRAGDEVQKLSLGNQQRVQLAAALVHDPEVLVLDEPFSGLDPVAVDVMSEVLKERASQGAAVVFSSHQLELVERLCDSVGIVRAGKMVANDTVENLRSSGARRLAVNAPDAPDNWTSGLAGVEVVGTDGHVVLLELADGVDDQVVLREAMKTGPVHEFAPRRPTITELFRHVVSEVAS